LKPKLPKLRIARRTGPLPRKLVVRDLRKGSGATVTRKDAITVNFFEATYPEALEKTHVGQFGPTRYGLNEVVKGWQLGLPGMRVGGKRELIVPRRLGDAGTTAIYVVELLGVERLGQ
jgi:peptidylprolyl isomerase